MDRGCSKEAMWHAVGVMEGLSHSGMQACLSVRGKSLYRGTSLTRNRPHPGPYSRTMPRVLRWSWAGGGRVMSEVTLYCEDVARGGCAFLGGAPSGSCATKPLWVSRL